MLSWLKQILTVIWMLFWYLPNIQMFLHKPRGNNQGSVGRMAAWWNEGKCSGERQNPTVSSEQLLSDLGEPTHSPHRAQSGGTCARCTTRTCASNRGCVCWEGEHDLRTELSSSWLQRHGCVLSVEALFKHHQLHLVQMFVKNLVCSDQNRHLSVIKYIYINRETSDIRYVTHALGHCTRY